MKTNKRKKAPWEEFENRVTSVFRLKGYEPITDMRLAGRQNDVLLQSSAEPVGSVIVECKYHDPKADQKVGVIQVEDFVARVLRLRNNGDVSAGYLITNTDFTAAAKGCLMNRIEEKFVFLRTFDSLMRQLIDFRPYLRRFVSQYEHDDMYLRYEPLNILRSGGKEPKSFENVSLDFINSDQYSTAILLGDYGTGKTTSCTRLFYEMATCALQDGYTGRIPCFIPLKYFNYTGTAPALIVKFLCEDVGVRNISYDAFNAMNELGLFVLILDGFDEMARRVTQQVREESFRAIGELCHKNAKVLISGRAGYFPAQKQFFRAVDMLRSRTAISDIRRSLGKSGDKISKDIFIFLALLRLVG